MPLILASLVVLTLAFVAAFIPINPAISENKAPTIKHKADCHPTPSALSFNSGTKPKTNNTSAKIIIKGTMTWN